MSTNDQSSELQNGDAKPQPDSELHRPEDTAIHSTNNDEGDSSKLNQPIQSGDNDIAPEGVDPKPQGGAEEESDKERTIESKDNAELPKEEGSRTFTMRELLNELKNGDEVSEVSEVAATPAAAPRHRLDFSPDMSFLFDNCC